MKKKVFTLLFALATFTAQAQVVLNETNFPDANFRASLAAKLGINEGDEITAEKIAKTTFLSVSNESIADLTGIEHFTALTSLGCSYNQLTSLDVSKNIALTSLACNKNQLTSLDVSKNTALTMLYCEYNQLATLDLSNQTGMTVKNVSTQYLTAKALKLADGRIGIDLGAEGFEAARFTELKADGAEISAEVTGQYLIIAENAESCPNKITYKYDTKYPIEATTMDVEIIPNTISLFTNAATFSNFKTVAVEKGKSVSIPMQITNKGKNHIKSISYTITTAGKASEESTISLNNLAFGTSADVSIKFPADIDVGKKLKMLTITKVNGEKNENLKRSATGNLITVSKRPVVVPVVEELTQTTCQWCPIGIEGMKET
ncbi:MAG: hypothetical protein IK067_02280, partial [Prevotella sp.]|nr:hypothetical protein [Prevotella sp.]